MHSTDTSKPTKDEVKRRYGRYAGLNNNRVRIRVTRNGKTYSHYVDGDPNDAKVQKQSKDICRAIEGALASGTFLDYWERLTGEDGQGKTNKGKSHLQAVDQDYRKYPLTTLELWDKYMAYREPHVSPNTVTGTYVKVVRNNIVKTGIEDLGQTHQMKAWVDSNLPPGTARRLLMHLSAACKWAVDSGLIPDNPYDGLYNKIKLPKASKSGDDEDWNIKAFTAEERDIIIETFKQSRYYAYYYPYVYFCFYTGCRPNEAQALMWKHIQSNKIVFEQRVVTNSQGRLEIIPGTKTEPRRTFPINSQMREFLDSIRPENVDPESLVFPGPKGSIMDQHNFCNRAWKKTLEQCGIDYRVPYQMRHTFITLTLKKETDVETVAKWVGNSAQVIWQHYASGDKDLLPPEL